MTRLLAAALALVLLTSGAGPISAQTIEGLEGPAAQAVRDEVRRNNLADPVSVAMFYGDLTGSNSNDALSVVYYPSGGNSDMITTWAWLETPGGYERVLDTDADDLFGIDPRDVTFSPGLIEVTTTVMNPGDPRCCPTGERRFSLRVGDGLLHRAAALATLPSMSVAAPPDGSWALSLPVGRTVVEFAARSRDGRAILQGQCTRTGDARGVHMWLHHQNQMPAAERRSVTITIAGPDARRFPVDIMPDDAPGWWRFAEPLSADFLDAFAAGATLSVHELTAQGAAEFGLRGTANAVRHVHAICEPPQMSAINRVSQLPFRDGRYLSDASMCGLTDAQIVARVGDDIHYMLYEIKSPYFNGTESICTVHSTRRAGTTIDIEASCELEGMVQDGRWSVDMVSPDAFGVDGTIFRRCQ